MNEGYPLEKLELKIGYRFRDTSLLKQAMTHSSYANEKKIFKMKDYERLEFLGDAVLELVSSEFLFQSHPEMPEGKLTKLRSSCVCEPALAFCAREIALEKFMFLGKGEEATALEDAKRALDSDPDNMQYQLLYQRIASGGSWYAGRRTQYQGPSSTTYCTGCAPWVALCLCSNICMPMCCGYGSGGYYPGGSI